MKRIFILAALCAFTTCLKAQNTNPFPANGPVGIGTTNPQAPLDVTQNVSTGNTVYMQSWNWLNDIYSYGLRLEMYNSGNSLDYHFIQKKSAIDFNVLSFQDGRVGIGTPAPTKSFDVLGSGALFRSIDGNQSQILLRDGAIEDPKSASDDGGIVINYYGYNSTASNFRNLTIFNGKGVDIAQFNGATGNVGIGTNNPMSTLQVEDGCSKASIGDAGGPGLNFGTSYLGFNASRSTPNNWVINSDQVNNGAGIIYGDIYGAICFSAVGSTSGAAKTLSDANVTSNIALKISPGGITYAKQVIVQATPFPDYVFNSTYALRPLSEVRAYIDQNHHLPEMPSAAEVEKDGLNLGEMNKLLTKKVEELTLYLIEKDKQLQQQQNQIDRINQQMKLIIKN